jgi:hypothetical protein
VNGLREMRAKYEENIIKTHVMGENKNASEVLTVRVNGSD